MEYVLLACVGVVLAPTLFVAGLHDVPNSIAIPVRTRALTASVATRVAAGFNALGVLLALPLGVYLFSWFDFPAMDSVLLLGVVLSALIAVLGWCIFTYFKGMPTSITHALLAALLGGTLATVALNGVDLDDLWSMPWLAPLLTLLVSPLVAFGLAYLLVYLTVRIARGADPQGVNEVSRTVQSVCVGLTSLGTGLQQGQRFSFVLLLALVGAGIDDAEGWLPYAYVLFAILIGAGCLTGGWRIGHVLAHRLVAIDPMRGMVSTTTTSALLLLGSLTLALPLSTSLTAASAIMGAGANQRFTTVNWRQAARIFGYWAATPVLVGVATAVLVIAMSPALV